MMFDGNVTVKKTSTEAEVAWKGFLVAAVVVVLQTSAFVRKKSMTAGSLHHEKLSGFSCGQPHGISKKRHSHSPLSICSVSFFFPPKS